MTDIELYANSFIDATLVLVYIDTPTFIESKLPIYSSNIEATDAGLVKGDLYFNLEGNLIVLGLQTGLIAQLGKAYSYLRRLF